MENPRAPHPLSLQQRWEKLSPAQRSLLQQRTADSSRDNRPRRERISTTQFGIWLHEQLHEGTSVYHNCAVLQLDGKLDEAALGAALARLHARHAPLRSRYEEDDDGQLWAVVDRPEAAPFQLHTVDTIGETNPQKMAAELVRAECSATFDLASGPVWRALCVRYRHDAWLLCIALHHIVSDGASLGIMFEELGTLYLALTKSCAADLPPLATSFFQLVEHREHGPGRQAGDRALDYWKARLEGMPHEVDLRWLGPGVRNTGGGGGAVPVNIDASTTDAFERVCRRCGASWFSGFAAMFSVLLHARSGQPTIPLLTPVDTRGADGAALVGCFVNNVVLRMEVEPALALEEAISRGASEVAAALANHEAPFGRVVAEAAARRTHLDRPLSNVAIVHNNAPTGVAKWGAVSVSRHPIPISAVRYDLALSISRHPDGVRGNVEFAEHLDPRSAQVLADDLLLLIRDAAADPGRRIGAVSASMQLSSPGKECWRT
jgi:hypothetical protein